jgi:lactoylglutathione lyase
METDRSGGWRRVAALAMVLACAGSAGSLRQMAAAQDLRVRTPDAMSRSRSEPDPHPAVAVALDHIGLSIADLGRSVEFYHGVLGLPETTAHYPGTRWLGVAPGLQIHLIPGRTTPVTDTESHVAFSSPDLASVIARLNAHHVAYDDGDGHVGRIARQRTDGVAQIYVRDPDGYVIEFNDAHR